jgi:hypothetical protein
MQIIYYGFIENYKSGIVLKGNKIMTVQYTTAILKEHISTYFKSNPGCITKEYDQQDISTNNLTVLETTLQNPKVWKRAEKTREGNQIFRCFLPDFELLEAHGYCDEDGVKVYIWTDSTDTKIVEFSLELT